MTLEGIDGGVIDPRDVGPAHKVAVNGSCFGVQPRSQSPRLVVDGTRQREGEQVGLEPSNLDRRAPPERKGEVARQPDVGADTSEHIGSVQILDLVAQEADPSLILTESGYVAPSKKRSTAPAST